MTQNLIVAQFNDYAAAHRAFTELIRAGIGSNEVGIITGDRSSSRDAVRNFGILEKEAETFSAALRRGRTLLAVFASQHHQARIADIIGAHRPAEVEELRPAGSIDT